MINKVIREAHILSKAILKFRTPFCIFEIYNNPLFVDNGISIIIIIVPFYIFYALMSLTIPFFTLALGRVWCLVSAPLAHHGREACKGQDVVKTDLQQLSTISRWCCSTSVANSWRYSKRIFFGNSWGKWQFLEPNYYHQRTQYQ